MTAPHGSLRSCLALLAGASIALAATTAPAWGEPRLHSPGDPAIWRTSSAGAVDSSGYAPLPRRPSSSLRPGRPAPESGSSFTGAWREILPAAPTRRDRPSITHDPLRDRLILFGGYDRSYWLNDLWEYRPGSDSSWVRLAATGEPPPGRSSHSAIYDPARDRLVVFGGHRSGQVLDDCWELALTEPPLWSRIETLGVTPLPRAGHVAVHDAAGDRMIIYGGDDGQYPLETRGDVWSLVLAGPATWTEESPLPASALGAAGGLGSVSTDTVPAPRSVPGAAFDPARNRVIIHGGAAGSSELLGDLWALDLDAPLRWELLEPVGSVPSPRDGQNAVYDATRDRMVVFGGNVGIARLDEVWELSFETLGWTLLPLAAGPTPRFLQGGVLDPARQKMIVFGGIEGPRWRGDTWAFDLAADSWTPAIEEGAMPDGRGFPAFALDQSRDCLLIFGGYAFGATGDDAWSYSIADHAWSRIETTGPAPVGRSGAVAIHDAARDRLIVFGGRGPEGGPLLADVWALSLGANPRWTLLSTTGTPPSERCFSAAVYDPGQDRMVVHGGFTRVWDPDEGQWREYSAGNTYALSLDGSPTWTALGIGPARSEMAYTWDPLRGRMVIATGLVDDGYGGILTGDLWSAPLSGPLAWSLLEPEQLIAVHRRGASLVMDPNHDRLLLFGGEGWGGVSNDVWSYAPGGSGEWTPITTMESPPTRTGHAAVWDDETGRMIVFGGLGGTAFYDVWELNAATELLDAPSSSPATLAMRVTNPARGHRVELALSMDGSGPARIDVLDVAGRLVVTRAVRADGAGWRRVQLGDSPGFSPGLYFVRVAQGNRAVTRKVCVLD